MIAIDIPAGALVVLVGVAGAGKSTFARAHFRPSEILSSDFFRGMVSDDEGNQDASADAFALLQTALDMRLKRGKLCVVDATNVRAEHRRGLLAKAQAFGRPAVAIVFDTAEDLAVRRAGSRTERLVEADVVRRQQADLSSQQDFLQEGFAQVFRIAPEDQVKVVRL